MKAYYLDVLDDQTLKCCRAKTSMLMDHVILQKNEERH